MLRVGGGIAAVACTGVLSLSAFSAYKGDSKRAHLLQASQALPRRSAFPSSAVASATANAETAKRALVVGGGAAGVSTAYALRKRGFEVLLIDAAASAAEECSAVAAGGMQRSNGVVDRQAWLAVAKSMLLTPKIESFFHLQLGALCTDPHFLRWITCFTRSSLFAPSALAEERQEHMLRFTCWAIKHTKDVIKQLGLERTVGFSSSGALRMRFEAGASEKKHNSNEPTKELTPEQALKLEPCIGNHPRKLHSAIYQNEASRADSMRFTKALVKECERLGVRFEFNKRVTALEVDEGVVKAVHCEGEVLELNDGDQLVVAAGSWTPKLLWFADLFVPVYPMKGYTLIMDLPPVGDKLRPSDNDLPHGTVFDEYMYTARLGERVRMASMGEFAGWDTRPNADVDASFRARALAQQPQLRPLIDRAKTRCGLRPFVYDGIVMLGKLPSLENTFINVGPGFNGWKVCVGGGELVASQMDGTTLDTLDPSSKKAFDVDMLTPRGRVSVAPYFARMCIDKWF